MNEIKKVLVIAYEYPPIIAGGIARTLKFCKYLPHFNWHPLILTVKNTSSASSNSLTKDAIEQRAHVYRSTSFEMGNIEKNIRQIFTPFFKKDNKLLNAVIWRLQNFLNIFSLPDNLTMWAVPASLYGVFLVYHHKISAIYSTSWPYSNHLCALIIKVITNKPWVADFRDPYLRHMNYGNPTPLRYKFDQWLERKICEKASFIITTTENCTAQFRNDYPEISPEKFVTIRNGFDPEEFSNVKKEYNNKFEILHTGSIYGTRRPDDFLKGVDLFLDNNPSAIKSTIVTFMGMSLDGDLNAYTKYPFVRVIGWQDREKVIHAVVNTPILLLLRHSECTLTIPGKLYEYIASGNYIIGLIGKQNEVLSILQEYKNCSVFESASPSQIAKVLEDLYSNFSKNSHQNTNLNTNEFSRKSLTEKLSGLLNSSSLSNT